jgi:5,5'-dehydrodivanillate O-demethylase
MTSYSGGLKTRPSSKGIAVEVYERLHMVSVDENRLLTEIGPGTRMGALLRRYWQPLGSVAEMSERWTKRIRIFGEDLVLFKDRTGAFGLMAEKCPHRGASLAYGMPTFEGLRCAYHGWMFDTTGRCIEMPNEPPESTYRDRVKASGYPVRQLGGLLWGYLGEGAAPFIPKLDGLVAEGTIRSLGKAVVNCNWLQIMENSVDSVHTEWLHGKYYEFLKEADGTKVSIAKHHLKIGFDEFQYGIVKRRVLEGHTEEDDDWKVGHPLVFPNTLAIGNAGDDWHEFRFQFRVPIDDTHTQHYWYSAFVIPPGVEVPAHFFDRVHEYDVPVRDANGEYILDSIHAQDIMAWETQGAIADRTTESLNSSDRGVTLYRRMLLRELARAEAGEDPKNVAREPAVDSVIELPLETKKAHRAEGFEDLLLRHQIRYAPIADELIAIFSRAQA